MVCFKAILEPYVKFACVWLLQYWLLFGVGYVGQISLNSRIDMGREFMGFMEQTNNGFPKVGKGLGFRHRSLDESLWICLKYH